jgi:hypothetical protein
MSALRQALADYLAVRRSLGYKLDHPEKLLTVRWFCQGSVRRTVAGRQVTETTIFPPARPASRTRWASTISSKRKTRAGLAW